MAISDIKFSLDAQGIALTLWNVLAGGHIRTDAEEEARRQSGENGRAFFGSWERNEEQRKICAALEKVAEQSNAKHITAGQCRVFHFHSIKPQRMCADILWCGTS